MNDITQKNIRKNFTHCNHTNQNSSFRLIMVNITSIFDLISFLLLYWINYKEKNADCTLWLTDPRSECSLHQWQSSHRQVRMQNWIHSTPCFPCTNKNKNQYEKCLCCNYLSNIILLKEELQWKIWRIWKSFAGHTA